MADLISKEKRSLNMSLIRGTDTKPEILVRKYLFSQGYRYRKNDKRYPGKPDIVLPKYNTVIFINGCFWHHHLGCKNATIPKTRTAFWMEKFNRNMENDRRNYSLLKNMGWNVIVVWECEIESAFDATKNKLTTALQKSACNQQEDLHL